MQINKTIEEITEKYLKDKDRFEISSFPYCPDITSARCIEIPYVASKVNNHKKILDIGTSLSDLTYLGLLTEIARKNNCTITSLDIIPRERVLNRFESVSEDEINRLDFNVGDIRNNGFKDNSFDLVLCISVLEHIGFDRLCINPSVDSAFDRPEIKPVIDSMSAYYKHNEDVKALNEIERILLPKGRLILTVPYGKGKFIVEKDSKERYSTWIEYNLNKWEEFKFKTPLRVLEERCFFRLERKGWFESKLNESLGYIEQSNCVLCSVWEKS